MTRPTVAAIDNVLGLDSPGITELEIRQVLDRYADNLDGNGFTHVAVLFRGGAIILAGPDEGDSIEKIEGMIGDKQFLAHMNDLFDLAAKINERSHKAGTILEVVIMCQEMTFALNLFGRKDVGNDRYNISEVVIPIVVTRSYLGAQVQRNSAKLIAELKELVESKVSSSKKH